MHVCKSQCQTARPDPNPTNSPQLRNWTPPLRLNNPNATPLAIPSPTRAAAPTTPLPPSPKPIQAPSRLTTPTLGLHIGTSSTRTGGDMRLVMYVPSSS